MNAKMGTGILLDKITHNLSQQLKILMMWFDIIHSELISPSHFEDSPKLRTLKSNCINMYLDKGYMDRSFPNSFFWFCLWLDIWVRADK